MIPVRWFTQREVRSLLWRAGGVAIASGSGLFAIKVFADQHTEQAPGFMAMVGWLSFLPLAQLGLGRPLYGSIRRRFVAGDPVKTDVQQALILFGRLGVLAAMVHGAISVWLVTRHGAGSHWWEIALFALGLAAMAVGALPRDIYYAVSNEDRYEQAELHRRIATLGAYVALWFGVPMGLIGTSLLAVAVWTQVDAAYAILGSLVEPSTRPQPLRAVRRDAGRYLLFTVNELLLYNLPLLIFSFGHNPSELIYVSVWMRLFQLLVLPMRMIVDARINRQTHAWFQHQANILKHEIRISVILASTAVVAALVGMAAVASPLLIWLGAPAMLGDSWLLISLAIWSFGNVIQHIYGSLTISYGSGFAFALSTSTGAAVLCAGTFLVARAIGWTPSQCLVASGLAYSVSALAYWTHITAEMSRDLRPSAAV